MRIYLLGNLSSSSASTASSSESIFNSSTVSWVTSGRRWPCAHVLSIPIRCSSDASMSRCATHSADSGRNILPPNLLWKLCRLSRFDLSLGFSPALVRSARWLFCLLANRLVWSESRLVPRLSGRSPSDSELVFLFLGGYEVLCRDEFFLFNSAAFQSVDV